MLPAPPRLPLPPPARLSNAGPSASAYGKTFASRRAISPSGSEDSHGSSSDDDGGTKTAARRSLAAAQKQQRQIGNQRTPIVAPMRTNALQPQPPAISTKPAAAQSVLSAPPACSVCEMAPAAVRCSECSPASALMCPPCDADMHRPQRLSRHVRHAFAPQSQPSMFRSDSQQSLASVPEEQTPKQTPTVTPLPTPTGAASAPPDCMQCRSVPACWCCGDCPDATHLLCSACDASSHAASAKLRTHVRVPYPTSVASESRIASLSASAQSAFARANAIASALSNATKCQVCEGNAAAFRCNQCPSATATLCASCDSDIHQSWSKKFASHQRVPLSAAPLAGSAAPISRAPSLSNVTVATAAAAPVPAPAPVEPHDAPPACSVCEVQPSSVRCNECAQPFCSPCSDDFHAPPKFRSHALQSWPWSASVTVAAAVAARAQNAASNHGSLSRSNSAKSLGKADTAALSASSGLGSAPTSVSADTCSSCNQRVAERRCRQCVLYFCAPCAAAAHKSQSTKHHIIETISVARRPLSPPPRSAPQSAQNRSPTAGRRSPPPALPRRRSVGLGPAASGAASVPPTLPSFYSQCSICEVVAGPTGSYCAACRAVFCATCNTQQHAFKKYSNHQVSPLSASTSVASAPIAANPNLALALALANPQSGNAVASSTASAADPQCAQCRILPAVHDCVHCQRAYCVACSFSAHQSPGLQQHALVLRPNASNLAVLHPAPAPAPVSQPPSAPMDASVMQSLVDAFSSKFEQLSSALLASQVRPEPAPASAPTIVVPPPPAIVPAPLPAGPSVADLAAAFRTAIKEQGDEARALLREAQQAQRTASTEDRQWVERKLTALETQNRELERKLIEAERAAALAAVEAKAALMAKQQQQQQQQQPIRHTQHHSQQSPREKHRDQHHTDARKTSTQPPPPASPHTGRQLASAALIGSPPPSSYRSAERAKHEAELSARMRRETELKMAHTITAKAAAAATHEMKQLERASQRASTQPHVPQPVPSTDRDEYDIDSEFDGDSARTYDSAPSFRVHRHDSREDHTSSSFTPAAGMVPASLGIPKLNLPPQTFVEPLSATDAAAQFDDNHDDGDNGDGDDPLDGLHDTKKKTYPPPRKPDPNKPARLGVAKLNAAKADLAQRRAKAAALEIPRPKSASATAAFGGWAPKMPWRLGHTGPKRKAPHTFGDHATAAAADSSSLHHAALPPAAIDDSDADGTNGRSKSAPKAAWRLGHSAPKRGGRTFGATAAAQSCDARAATADVGIDGDDDDILGLANSQPDIAQKSLNPRPITSLEAAASLLKARPRRDAKNPFSIDQQVKQQMQRFKAAVQTNDKGQARPASAPIRTKAGSGGGIDVDDENGDQDIDIDGLTPVESAHRGAPLAAWTEVTNVNTAPRQTSTVEHCVSDDDDWRRPWAERPPPSAATADAATVNAREYIRAYMEAKRSADLSSSATTSSSTAASLAASAAHLPNLRPSLSAASVRGGTSEALEIRMRAREYMLKQREGLAASDDQSAATLLNSSAMFRDPYLDSAHVNATFSSLHAWAAPMHTPSKLASLDRIGFASTRTSPSLPTSGESATDMLDRLRASIRLRASASAVTNAANSENIGATTNSPPLAELSSSKSAIVSSLDFSLLDM